jgi:hypothetical protein
MSLDDAIGQVSSPYCPGDHQRNRQQNSDANYSLFLLAMLMAIVMRRYNTGCIA